MRTSPSELIILSAESPKALAESCRALLAEAEGPDALVRLARSTQLAPRAADGARLAIVALTGYALLPILRNTYTGIRGVDPALIDVAEALGMTGMQRLFKVELPLAMSFILAGLRTATVLSIGVTTIAAAVGAGGLGELIFRGVASVDNGLVLAGAIPAALLALAADGLLGFAEKRLTVRR